MNFSPLLATGIVLTTGQKGSESFSGTCFQFREDNVLLTAAHCVDEHMVSARVFLPQLKRYLPVTQVIRHPVADIAALKCEEKYAYRAGNGYPETAFWDGVANWSLGEEFNAFGYPSEGPSFAEKTTPTPRLFVGHYQRFFQYRSPAEYSYLAGELSIPAPGGLSGGPIFRPGAHRMVTGLVTANAESYAVTDSVDEVNSDGSRYRQESRRVINYGLALMLSDVADWLHVAIPNPTRRGWVLKNPMTGDDPTEE